jgi:hypothetical protein
MGISDLAIIRCAFYINTAKKKSKSRFIILILRKKNIVAVASLNQPVRGRRRTNDTAPELDRTPTNPRLSCNRLNQAEASIMKEALPPTLEHGG